MARRAVEAFLKPAPLVEDKHSADNPWNRGMVFAYVGRDLVVYMLTESPGEFFLDEMCKRPASDDQAKCAFGLEAFARYRHQAREVASNRRIEQEIAAVVAEPSSEQIAEQRRQELRAKAAKAIRDMEKKSQREADLMITRDLGPPPEPRPDYPKPPRPDYSTRLP